MERHISDKFRDDSFADAFVSVVLARAEEEREELDRFPAHLLVLTRSPYFLSQVNFTRQQEEQRGRSSSRDCAPADDAAANSRCTRSRSRSSTRQDQDAQPEPPPPQRSTRPSSISGTEKPTLVLAVEDRAHAPAAVAVIADLYGFDNVLDSLQPEELVYVIQYADMMQGESVATAAVAQLETLARWGKGLTDAVMAALAALPAWPSCMLPLIRGIAKHATALDTTATVADAEAAKEGAFTLSSKNSSIQQVLVAALGNLEAVWQHQDLRRTLLELPLAAMQLLLSSDQLQVYSEDTVLFTVIKFIQVQGPTTVADAKWFLPGLIRVPQLSSLQLSVQSSGDHQALHYLQAYHRELQDLQQLSRLEATMQDIREYLLDRESAVPSSWMKDARRKAQLLVNGVCLTWHVAVVELQALVKKCSEDRHGGKLHTTCCADLTPPLGGVQWQIWVSCTWSEQCNGVTLGAFTSAVGLPHDVYHRVSYNWQLAVTTQGPFDSGPLPGGTGVGCMVFVPGVMTNGWDGLAWAAQGLPTQGEVQLKVTIHCVR